MKKHLVLAGGGHAHMVTISRISDLISLGHKVTVIGPSDHHYYSGMGPGMLGSSYEPDDIRFAVRQQVEKQGGIFIRDYVDGVDPKKKQLTLRSGTTVDYDIVSFNTGSHIHMPLISGDSSNIYPVKPIEGLYQARQTISSQAEDKPLVIAVVGGGPAGAEVAGNVSQLLQKSRNSHQILLFAGSKFLARFPQTVQEQAKKILTATGVEFMYKGHLQEIKDNMLLFDSGYSVRADCIILATGVHPDSFFAAANLATGADNGLLVNSFLQHIDHPDIFGGGDCISFKDQPLDKVGVYAVRENPVLFHNLKAALQGEELQPFNPGGDYLLIFNLGNGLGLLRKKCLQTSGHIAFMVKDWIDRKFIKRFQQE